MIKPFNNYRILYSWTAVLFIAILGLFILINIKHQMPPNTMIHVRLIDSSKLPSNTTNDDFYLPFAYLAVGFNANKEILEGKVSEDLVLEVKFPSMEPLNEDEKYGIPHHNKVRIFVNRLELAQNSTPIDIGSKYLNNSIRYRKLLPESNASGPMKHQFFLNAKKERDVETFAGEDGNTIFINHGGWCKGSRTWRDKYEVTYTYQNDLKNNSIEIDRMTINLLSKYVK